LYRRFFIHGPDEKRCGCRTGHRIGKSREALDSESDRPAAEEVLRASKAAMDEAEQSYHDHRN